MMSETLQPKSSLRRAWPGLGDESGSNLVEYGLVCLMLMMLLFGIMDFSRFMYAYHFVSEVAREGTRYAAVRGYTFKGVACTATHPFACEAKTSGTVPTYVQGLTPLGINPANLTVTPTWPATNPDGTTSLCTAPASSDSPGCYVQVMVSYPFHFMLPFLPQSTSTYTMTSTSEMVIEQ